MNPSNSLLITGGTGTLGKAIVKTALKEAWDCDITIYSRSEFQQALMRQQYPQCRYILGDVRDYTRLSSAIAGHSTVLHLAALKRLPECAEFPTECFETNVIGSQNVVRACIEHQVSRCVGISTDKACRSTTVYGASKLILEGLFQSAAQFSGIFTLVRYGNVVASRGSVIPLWRKQQCEGKPLTITDERMTRFWMRATDAIDLIRQALEAPPGTITVPKMGALGVADMARLVCPGSDLVETGLRSMEKLHEDLIHEGEHVEDVGKVWRVFPNGDPSGIAYTSEIAPTISTGDFLTMLREADQDES